MEKQVSVLVWGRTSESHKHLYTLLAQRISNWRCHVWQTSFQSQSLLWSPKSRMGSWHCNGVIIVSRLACDAYPSCFSDKLVGKLIYMLHLSPHWPPPSFFSLKKISSLVLKFFPERNSTHPLVRQWSMSQNMEGGGRRMPLDSLKKRPSRHSRKKVSRRLWDPLVYCKLLRPLKSMYTIKFSRPWSPSP